LEVSTAVRILKMDPVRTAFRSPWQNGVTERCIESCRRDLLDQIAAMNERHLKRPLSEYVRYYHQDRTHLGLGKGTPNGRSRVRASGRVLSQERLGWLHHRYDRVASAGHRIPRRFTRNLCTRPIYRLRRPEICRMH